MTTRELQLCHSKGNNRKMDGSPIKNRKIVDKVVIYFKPDSDNENDDLQASNRNNIEYIKHDIKDIVDYSANTIEYHPDGSIVITPHYLENLPNEILTLIIDYYIEQQKEQVDKRYFYELTLVNKQFYDVTNPLLWHTPVISNAATLDLFVTCLAGARQQQTFTTTSAKLAENHNSVPHGIWMAGHHLRQLDLQGDHWEDIEFSHMMPFISLLETLTVDSSAKHITSASLKHLPRCCPHLTKLSLTHTSISQSCIDAISQHCHQLRHLSLCTKNLPMDTFKTLANGVCCISLKTLHLYSNTDDVIPRYSDEAVLNDSMIKDMARLDCLTDIAFIGTLSSPPPTLFFTITNTTPSTPAWPLLSSLNISNGKWLDDTVLIPFIKSHRHLQWLRLNCMSISNAALTVMAAHLPSLTHVTLQNNGLITGEGVYQLVRNCHHLKRIQFQYCTHILTSMAEFHGLGYNDVTELGLAEMERIRQRDGD